MSATTIGEPTIVSHIQTVPADISGQMLDLDEDDDLEVFSKVKKKKKIASKCEFDSCYVDIWQKMDSE